MGGHQLLTENWSEKWLYKHNCPCRMISEVPVQLHAEYTRAAFTVCLSSVCQYISLYFPLKSKFTPIVHQL